MTEKKESPEVGALHGFSIMLGLVGIAAIIGSLMMETSIETGYGIDREMVYNLGLLQSQLMVFQAGLACIIAAVVIWGVDRLGR